MKKLATPLIMLAALVLAACGDPAETPVTGDDAAEAAVSLIMAELSNARTLEVSAGIHGQTVEERINHLTGLLQWFEGQEETVAADDTITHPMIDTAFTVVLLEVEQYECCPGGMDSDASGPDPEVPGIGPVPEMMHGKIYVYTKASVPGAIIHAIDWDYYSYIEDYEIPEHLAFDTLDAALSDELLTVIGCFHLPNETNRPNEQVDYWGYAETHHVFITDDPYNYREDQRTSDEEDTRFPTPSEDLIINCRDFPF